AAARGKGIDIVIECARQCPQADFVIIGLDSWPAAPANCLFVGTIDNREMPRWLQAATLYVLPSQAEGTPVSLLEAMACATPGIVSCVGGVPDLLQDGVTGRIIPTLATAAFAAAVKDLLGMPPVRLHEMGSAARATIVARYDSVSIAQRLLEVYRMVRSATNG
ncbi:MAG TPA: glycosyltransferase family 4 protein, partial [Candidatus Acidoferrales bacterium]|nr:glycosyltransferase family 4 protein [Candidatus Acidoferrales bacterium]